MAKASIGQLLKRITIDPDKCNGQPCIRGLEITVEDIVQRIMSRIIDNIRLDEFFYSDNEEGILDIYPELTQDDIQAVALYYLIKQNKLEKYFADILP